jgi:hypothetical protein
MSSEGERHQPDIGAGYPGEIVRARLLHNLKSREFALYHAGEAAAHKNLRLDEQNHWPFSGALFCKIQTIAHAVLL